MVILERQHPSQQEQGDGRLSRTLKYEQDSALLQASSLPCPCPSPQTLSASLSITFCQWKVKTVVMKLSATATKA